MFMEWMNDYGSDSLRKSWMAVLDGGQPYQWDDDLQDALVKKEVPPFMTQTLICLRNFSRYANTQLKYIGFILKFKGLSRSGIDFTNWLGLTPCVRSLDGFIADSKSRAKRHCR